jgi:hypothetical protein
MLHEPTSQLRRLVASRYPRDNDGAAAASHSGTSSQVGRDVIREVTTEAPSMT